MASAALVKIVVAASVFVISSYGQTVDPLQTEIAFSAGLTHHTVLGDGDKVVYDRIFTNVGSGYNSATGEFICPQTGLYVIQIHSLSRAAAYMYLELYHNYHYVVSLWAYSDTEYSSSGNSVILQLTKGDQVYVENVSGWDSELYGDPSEVYATFSGYLISPVYEEFPLGPVG